jgi:hypothetical protein
LIGAATGEADVVYVRPNYSLRDKRIKIDLGEAVSRKVRDAEAAAKDGASDDE